MVKAKIFVLTKHFDGYPKESDFKVIEEELPAIQDGEYLAEAVYLSVDPYMRAHEPNLELNGEPFIGTQIAKIIESKNPKYPIGKYVCSGFGWRSHTIGKGDIADEFLPTYVLPDFWDLPLSLGLGILGMPGNTAYFGFLEICKPQPGDTVVVTGAAGAVGSAVGQIAKIKGCKVIGIAGSDKKGKWLTEELGFDHFINYKTANLEEVLPKIAPKGIDCYFDNVGGEVATIILNNMSHRGRISVCGAISGYNEIKPKATIVQFPLIFKELTMEGFIVTRWKNRWMEGIQQNLKWIQEGKIKYRETVTEGFGNMSKAFIDMLNGENVGKAIVKV